MRPPALRLDPSAYPHTIELHPRFADVDPLWHLNNVRIVELYQEARISFHLSLWKGSNFDAHTRRLLVARQSVDYLGEVKWPGPISIGVGVSRMGNTSYSIGLAMFQNGRCAGISDAVLVYATEQGSAPVPAFMREVLAAKMLPPDAMP